MQFAGPQKRHNKTNPKVEKEDLYGHTLKFYDIIPDETVYYWEFEELAINRLKALKVVENVSRKFVRGTDEYHAELARELRKDEFRYLYKTYDPDNKDYLENNKKDYLSHFLLRLVFARDEDHRRWFLLNEVELFRFRFINESTSSIKQFIKVNNLPYTPISDDEKQEVMEGLIAAHNLSQTKVEAIEFYKVPFYQVPKLLAKRQLYLADGYAYILGSDFINIPLRIYVKYLSDILLQTQNGLPNMYYNDPRMEPLLNRIQKHAEAESQAKFQTIPGQYSVDDIEELSRTSFPLCMRYEHEALKSDHHLKHVGRMQYGLFLKGIGISMEDSLKFWRSEMTKNPNIDQDKFDKMYAYNVRYNYGKEGQKKDFSPYTCMSVIKSAPGPGQCHGCPYSYSNDVMLKQRLQSYNMAPDAINEVLDLKKKGHYQIACAKYFELTHPTCTPGTVAIHHPNQYFADSQALITGKKMETAYKKPFRPKNETAADAETLPEEIQTEMLKDDFNEA